MLHDTEKRYQMIKKSTLALITSARPLRPYFQSHQVVFKMNYPIKQVLRKSELVERMVAWFVKLSKFNIQYESHGPMKTQFMVDFMQNSVETTQPPRQVDPLHWRASIVKGSGAGIILEGPDNITLEQTLKLNFRASNNQAEYEAFIACLKLAREVRAKRLRCNTNLQLLQG